jgi:hypothetical protein
LTQGWLYDGLESKKKLEYLQRNAICMTYPPTRDDSKAHWGLNTLVSRGLERLNLAHILLARQQWHPKPAAAPKQTLTKGLGKTRVPIAWCRSLKEATSGETSAQRISSGLKQWLPQPDEGMNLPGL